MLRKILNLFFWVLICSYADVCFAFHCNVISSGAEIKIGGGEANVYVHISPFSVSDSILVYDPSSDLQCTNDVTRQGGKTDRLRLTSLTTSLVTPMQSFAYINGNQQSIPITNTNQTMFSLDNVDGTYIESAFLPIKINMEITYAPADPIPIRANDHLYDMTFEQDSISDSSGSVMSKDKYIWHIFAANDAIIIPSTCQINNNQTVTVDFGVVTSIDIGTTVDNTVLKKSTPIEVECDSSVNQSAGVSFIGTEAAGFDSTNALVTSDPNLGVVITDDESGKVVPLNTKAGMPIMLNNGLGHKTINVSLVKKNTTAILAGGEFQASAVMLVTAD